MVVTALRGGLGFLTTLPIGHDTPAWDAFRATPAVLPLVGYLIGALLLIPFLLPLPATTQALLFVVWLYALTGINHIDGVADVGDAAVVHGDADRRRAVLADTTVGVGAVLTVAILILGLGLAAYAIASVEGSPLAIIVSVEVGAKLAIVLVAFYGHPSHDGYGAEFMEKFTPKGVALAVLVASPAVLVTGSHPAAAVSLLGALLCGVGMLWWARTRLNGVNGDVLGATNELARLAGLHLGVIAWMLW